MRYLILFLLSSFSLAQSQNFSRIEGMVKDSSKQPVPFAAISLHKIADSSLVKSVLCDEKGVFSMEKVKAGDYFITASTLGYQKAGSSAIHLAENENKKIKDLILKALTTQLKEIQVAAQKPFIEHRADKTIVNVENSIVSVGNSAYEVLERSPGVAIDQDGNVSLNGKQGVNVMMDGKPMQMSAEQLANYLKGLPSSSLEKIELITNPSSKYDASGLGGIIDIKTKKGRKDGFNTSIYANYGQGMYEKVSSGLSFNAKYKKLNWFGNFDFGKRKDFYDLHLDRTFYKNGLPDTRFNQRNFVMFPFNTGNAKLGVDFYATKNTTFGAIVSGNGNYYNSPGTSNASAYNAENALQYYYNTESYSKEKRERGTINLNFKHKIDTSGSEITADADFATFNSPVNQVFDSQYSDLNYQPLSPESSVRSDVQAHLNIYALKTDYTHPFNSKTKLEAGAKSSYVTADNNKTFFNTVSGTETLDADKTNHFIYKENINAAYTTLSREFGKFSAQLGLRAEQTVVHGNQITTHITFDKNYTQLFPSALFSYTLNDNHAFSANYSRRIERPNYQSLNPFIIIIDPTFYKQGNPNLDPELAHSFELGYTFKQFITFNTYYVYSLHQVGAVLLQNDELKITTQTDQNIAYSKYIGCNIDATLKLFKWWNCYISLNIYEDYYRGELQGQDYSRGNTVFTTNTTNSFILPKGFSAELSYFYKSREVFNVLDLNPMSSLNIGVKRSFFEKKLVAKIGANDIFYTGSTSGAVHFNTTNEAFLRQRDSRVVTLSLTYNIGKGGNSSSLKHKSGAEDETKRAGESN